MSTEISVVPNESEDAPWYGAIEFRTLAETVPALLFVSSARGNVIYTNSAYQRYAGAEPENLLGLGYLDVLHPEDRPRAEHLWTQIAVSTQPYEIEHRMRRHDGTFRWHQVRGAPILDKFGQVLRWIGVCTDIQDLRTAVESARDMNELLAIVGRSTDAIVFAKDAAGRFVFANDATLQALDARAEEVIGSTVDANASKASDARSIDENDARVLESGEMIVVEERWTSRAGVERIYRSTKGPWRRADGTVGVVGITTDITLEREFAEQMREQDHAYRNLVDNVPFLLWLTDAQGELIVRNNLWQSYTGLPTASNDLAFLDLVDPRDYEDFIGRWRLCVEECDILQTTVRLKDVLLDDFVLHRVVAVPVRNTQGGLSGWVGSAVPVD